MNILLIFNVIFLSFQTLLVVSLLKLYALILLTWVFFTEDSPNKHYSLDNGYAIEICNHFFKLI